MSTQETWEDAKAHRDGLAVKATRALVQGRIGDANVWANEFAIADADMGRARLGLNSTVDPEVTASAIIREMEQLQRVGAE